MIELYFYEEPDRVYLFEADVGSVEVSSDGSDHYKTCIKGSVYVCLYSVPSKIIADWRTSARDKFDYSNCVRVFHMLPDAEKSLTKLYSKLVTI